MIDQIMIALTGATAVWLSQDRRESWRRYACIFGMLSQPFWFYAAFQAQQWGIFLICFIYAWAWFRGFSTHWLKPWLNRNKNASA